MCLAVSQTGVGSSLIPAPRFQASLSEQGCVSAARTAAVALHNVVPMQDRRPSAAGGVRGTGEQRPPTLASSVAMLAMQLSPLTTCTTADETGAYIVIEVSAASLRPGLSLPCDVHIVYMSWTPRSPCRPGHVSGWLRSCLDDDGSVCREPTFHLSCPETH
jgi:hypothetical protein